MKVIIAGSRDFNNADLVAETMNELNIIISEVVCGDAKGADTLGATWASANDIAIKHYPADWDTYGRSAGIIRNKQMAEYADFLIAFWDGKSHGTKNMIDTMQQMGKHGKVILY